MRRATPPTPVSLDEALDRALARADVYRVLAAAFRDPDDPGAHYELELRTLRSAAQRLGSSATPAAWTAIRRISRRDARAAEHRTIFGHVIAHGCPPYETEFGRRHVACELEFLALLSLKEAVAAAGADEQRQQLCRDAARHFLQDHPGRWVRALAARIAQRVPDSGYAAAAAIAATLLGEHALELGAIPVLLDPDDLIPIVEEPDGFTFECGVDVAAGDLAPPGSG